MYTLEIVPNLYQITIRYANMFLIVEKSLTLIDTGFRGSTPYIVECIHKLGRKPEEIGLVILTHNHLDHTGGLEELRKLTMAKVAAHKTDVHIPEDTIPYPAGNIIGVLLRTPWLSSFRRQFVLGADGVDMVLEGEETFDILGGLQIIPTPGHTAGSISLYAPKHKLLIAGDAMNKRRDILRMPLKTVSTNLQEVRSSIRRMAELDVEILCVGHGRPIMQNAKASLQALVTRLKL
ncbi:MAG: MBL fold metallo-hydrolase [Dehalococcoidales bacterium]|nr:MBL fold metallo-hydrolase [Dehalococcoidales bacterium]